MARALKEVGPGETEDGDDEWDPHVGEFEKEMKQGYFGLYVNTMPCECVQEHQIRTNGTCQANKEL